jgi:hypothetical protein
MQPDWNNPITIPIKNSITTIGQFNAQLLVNATSIRFRRLNWSDQRLIVFNALIERRY